MFPAVDSIIRAYASRAVRLYATIRFAILRPILLDEIGQYLPMEGTVLDVGCGFGLFAFYFAAKAPGRKIVGFDLNAKRVDFARRAAECIGTHNVDFYVRDACAPLGNEEFDAVYMIDLLHHVPARAVPALLDAIAARLGKSGVLLIKEISARPRLKKWFTWVLDKAVDRRTPVNYWAISDLRSELERHSFSVRIHRMTDLLPFPHVLYICGREPGERN